MQTRQPTPTSKWALTVTIYENTREIKLKSDLTICLTCNVT